jgi:hypothetical protein
MEQLEARDVPASFSFEFATEGILRYDSTGSVSFTDIGGNTSTAVAPGDDITIAISQRTADGILRVFANDPQNVRGHVTYQGGSGWNAVQLEIGRTEVFLSGESGPAELDAFRIVSPTIDPLPTQADNFRFTTSGISRVIGSVEPDIFHIAGVVATSIDVGQSISFDRDQILFADGARLVPDLFNSPSIAAVIPVDVDFNDYATPLSIDLSSGRLEVTSGEDPVLFGPLSKVGRVIGGAGDDTFTFSGFGLPLDGWERAVTLMGGVGDDTFILENRPTDATSPIRFLLAGGIQSFSGPSTLARLGDTIRIDADASPTTFDLHPGDPDSPLGDKTPQLVVDRSPSEKITVRFREIESFRGSAAPDVFISTLSRLGMDGHLFEGRGGGDIYAVWNQVADTIVADAEDFLSSIDSTLDQVAGFQNLSRPSTEPRRGPLPGDLFTSNQKKSMAGNSGVITPENQRLVYQAFVVGLFDSILGRKPTTEQIQFWVNDVIEGRRLSSLEVVREFVLGEGDFDRNGTRDFYERFFSGHFHSAYLVADPRAAALAAAAGPGLKATAIAQGIFMSDNTFVERVLDNLLGFMIGSDFIPEDRTILQFNAFDLLARGGTWEDVLVLVANSDPFLRTTLRRAVLTSHVWLDVIPPLPRFSIVPAAVPTLALFRDGQWRFDADQLSLDARFEQKIQFGVAIDRPILGDWNGDGLPDLGVYRDGIWYLDTNGIVGWQGDDTTVSFGVQIDIPIVGDWDGNGTDDLGVFRQGTWYLDTNGTPGWQGNDSSAEFGVASDVPVAADWNGDGQTDLGALRQALTLYVDTNTTRGWQGDDQTKFLSRPVFQPFAGDSNLNGFGDLSQWGATQTSLAVFDAAPNSPSTIPIQARFEPGDRPVAWSRGNRVFSPSRSQYAVLASAGIGSGGGGFGFESVVNPPVSLPLIQSSARTSPTQAQAGEGSILTADSIDELLSEEEHLT